MGIRSHNYEGGISIIHLFPCGIRIGLTSITPHEYARRKEAKRQEYERFKKVCIPKQCRDCGMYFDCEKFPKYSRGTWASRCHQCFRRAANESKKKHREKMREQLSPIEIFDNKIKQYRIVCRGSDKGYRKTVTIKARSEAEARQKVFEVGLIPF